MRLLPNSVVEHTENEVVITNYEGKVYRYSQTDRINGSSSLNSEAKASLQDICQLPA